MAEAASNSGPRAVLEQMKTLWGKQSKSRRMIAVAALVGVVGIVGVTRLVNREGGWSVVSEGASPDDTQELLAALQSRNLPVRLTNGKVEVASARVDEARAAAAAAGLPRAGKGFETFEGASLGQSSFAEQVNFKRALQVELSRSVAALAQVQSARIHLALGKRSVFKDKDERASASVALHLHPGQTLSAEQVRGVRQLVANAIDGMTPEAVVVVDNHGNLLDGAEVTTANKQANIEQAITLRVRNMLERVVGVGKVSVSTSAIVDDREINETSETYDPNTVIRSQTRTIDSPDVNGALNVLDASGVAGTRGNLPGSQAAGGGAGSGSANGHIQETKNFEISRTVKQTKSAAPQIQRLTLAIVVDEKLDKDGKPVARTAAELKDLTAIARNAAGIDDKRGDQLEIRSIPFAPVEEPAPSPVATSKLPLPLPILVALGVGVLALLGTVVWALKRSKNKAVKEEPLKMTLAFPAPVADLERVLDARDASGAPALPEVPPPPQLPAAPLRDRVLTTVRADVDRTAEVLTAWLSEPPPAAAVVKGAKS